MSKTIESCRVCGSKALTWFAQNTVHNGIQQNRLNTNDITCMFVLGCDECSETLQLVTADEIAAQMNAAPVVERQEPVAWMVGKTVWTYKADAVNIADGREVMPLYTSPPAPVAVVLPEKHEDRCDSSEAEAYQNGWNACLDKVKELNQ